MHDEIACLAFLNWKKDGSPPGKDLQYWLEAESQIKATWPLLIREFAPRTGGNGALGQIKPRHTRNSSRQFASVP